MSEPPAGLTDTLVARLRARAADPARRTDQRPSVFSDRIQTLDLGQLLGQVRGFGASLRAVVGDNQAGRVDPATTARVDALAAELQTPAERPPVVPALPAAVDRAEGELGFPLPADLRRLYLEVGDGGFGPSAGLLSIGAVAARYRSLAAEVPRTQRWPDRLLPLVDDGSVIVALDASSEAGPVRSWDPDGLGERSGDAAWRRSFEDVAPSLAAWLEGWLGARSPDEIRAEMMRKAMIEQVKASRARYAAMTPEQRAAAGLPEVGWEQQIGGHLGLSEDELR